jgi:hypothetical protein
LQRLVGYSSMSDMSSTTHSHQRRLLTSPRYDVATCRLDLLLTTFG